MRQKKHNYNSNAIIHYINNYSYTYNTADKDGTHEESIYALKMPVIIQSDNKVWELACIFLQSLLIEDMKGQSSLESTANALLDYLRFMEHTGLDILHLPFNEHERVTYRYRAYLLKQIRHSKTKPSTANQKLTKVIKFYNFCIKNRLFHKDSLRNLPYQVIEKRFAVITDFGLTHDITVQTTDINIRVPKRNLPADAIQDGGILHPLTENEQKIVINYLKNNASREFQLISYLALETGARLQTICTIRVQDIRNLLDQTVDPFDDTYSLKVGGNTHIDTKNGTMLNIKIPSYLVKDIISYINSKSWKDRSKLSFYGNSSDNYLFLTSRGNPYYTSLREIEDRVSTNSLKGFKPARGLSVISHLNEMRNKINSEDVKIRSFSFHDFRATFGMNTVKSMLACNFNNDQVLMYLKDRMGHRSINTTMRYLEHTEFSVNVVNSNTKFSSLLNQYSDR